MTADTLERRVGDLTVRIDRTTCIGSANCTKIAGDLFVIDDENLVTFREPASAPERERVIEACSVCPVDALSVLDAEGRRLVP
ncbi:MAG: ferredoxin [Gemmatimonadota bacterium]